MNLIQSRSLVCVLTIAAVGLVATPSAAQQAKPVPLQSALASDVGTMSEKFVGLARVMAGKYDWRPGQGVRSVGEVLNLIVNENRMLAGLLGAPAGGAGEKPAPITDPALMQETLKTTYATMQKAIGSMSDADLGAGVKMFGREMTKQGAVLMLLFDQHEHLGQSIAYARQNSVVPPWSK